jgi:uncharacterized OsmC-like protein
MTDNIQTSTIVNGLDTVRINETVEALKAQPTLARFQWRAQNQWKGGTESRSLIKDFYGVGQENTSRPKPFVYENDEPPLLLGNDRAANPVEHLLHALAGCITITFVIHATARGIKIESISTTIEGDMDLQGVLGLDDSVSPAYEEIRVKMDIKADCSDKELDELLQFTHAHSPTCQSVCRPVPVIVERAASVAIR